MINTQLNRYYSVFIRVFFDSILFFFLLIRLCIVRIGMSTVVRAEIDTSLGYFSLFASKNQEQWVQVHYYIVWLVGIAFSSAAGFYLFLPLSLSLK